MQGIRHRQIAKTRTDRLRQGTFRDLDATNGLPAGANYGTNAEQKLNARSNYKVVPMSFASFAEGPFTPARPSITEWRRATQTAARIIGVAAQSAAVAAVLWLIVAAPGLLE